MPRWVPVLFAVLSVALAAGIVRRFASAPPLHLAVHWRLAWGGFDVGIAALLAATGLALFRRSALAEVLAAMTATMLCCDAWLDVLSSVGQGTSATVIAVAEAAFAELPLAALFAWVAVRFARAVADARPALQRAGFRIHRRRLIPPHGGLSGAAGRRARRESRVMAAVDAPRSRRAARAAAPLVAAGRVFRIRARADPLDRVAFRDPAADGACRALGARQGRP